MSWPIRFGGLTEDCPTLLWPQCHSKWLRDIRDIAVHLHHLGSIRLNQCNNLPMSIPQVIILTNTISPYIYVVNSPINIIN